MEDICVKQDKDQQQHSPNDKSSIQQESDKQDQQSFHHQEQQTFYQQYQHQQQSCIVSPFIGLAKIKEMTGSVINEGDYRLITEPHPYNLMQSYSTVVDNLPFNYKRPLVFPSTDPFARECKIPLPNLINSNFLDSASFIRRRNERERARVKNVNEGFDRLRKHLPLTPSQREKRLSKVETLRMAIGYIKHLEILLRSSNGKDIVVD